MSENQQILERNFEAYKYILEIFKIYNDNYFKRTQVLMVAIQSVLFVSSIHYLSRFGTKSWSEKYSWLLLAVVALLGIGAAWLWYRANTAQRNYLEFCRFHLRNIEAYFEKFDIPLYFFTSESKAYFDRETVRFQSSEDVDFIPGKRGIMQDDTYIPLAMTLLWVIFLILCGFKCYQAF